MNRAKPLLLTLLIGQPTAEPAGEAAPLGSALIIDLSDGPAAVVHAAAIAQSCPWLTVCCITGRINLDVEMLQAVRSLPEPVILINPGATSVNLACLTTLRARPAPSAEEFARYIAGRTRNVAILPALAAALDVRRIGHRSTLSRRLRKFSPLSASDWRNVHRLCAIVPRGVSNAEGAAWQGGQDPRTLRKHLRCYLNVEYAEAKDRLGWHWIPEAALRHVGILKALTALTAMEA